ncbi:MAG: hypothetical protein ABIH21_01825 [Patescibacteria group bacterium]
MHFIALGSNPILSLCEINSATKLPIKSELVVSENILVIDKNDIDTSAIEQLGGAIKHGEIFNKTRVFSQESVEDAIFTYINKGKFKGKIHFGISVYGDMNTKHAQRFLTNRNQIGLAIKKRLKDKKLPVRFVVSREKQLSSVVVSTNKLLTSAGEFVLIVNNDTLWIGRTKWVQDFKYWSQRDFGRPARDPKSGMLPPKLSRIMINLAGVDPKKSTLLDPFCGSGTIPMEASILGFKKIIGADISKKAIHDSEKNLKWFFNLNKQLAMPIRAQTPLYPCLINGQIGLVESSADDLFRAICEPIDAIVTETYLGPPLKGNENKKQIEKNIEDVMELYRENFPLVLHLLKTGGKAVIAFPVFCSKDSQIFLPIKELVSECGFDIVDPIPKNVPEKFQMKTKNGGILYSRPNQKVAREIIVIQKNESGKCHRLA